MVRFSGIGDLHSPWNTWWVKVSNSTETNHAQNFSTAREAANGTAQNNGYNQTCWHLKRRICNHVPYNVAKFQNYWWGGRGPFMPTGWPGASHAPEPATNKQFPIPKTQNLEIQKPKIQKLKNNITKTRKSRNPKSNIYIYIYIYMVWG